MSRAIVRFPNTALMLHLLTTQTATATLEIDGQLYQQRRLVAYDSAYI
jgi:hypothetical protein